MTYAYDLYPSSHDLCNRESVATIVIFQGVEIPRSEYALFAEALSNQGFNVIVPDLFPQNASYLCPTREGITHFLLELSRNTLGAVSAALQAPLWLMGHSAGGIAAVEFILNNTTHFSVAGLVLYGSNVPMKAASKSISPALMLSGDRDEIATPAMTLKSFQILKSSLKILVRLDDFHHYSLTASGAPENGPSQSGDLHPYGSTACEQLAILTRCFVENCLEPNRCQEALTDHSATLKELLVETAEV